VTTSKPPRRETSKGSSRSSRAAPCVVVIRAATYRGVTREVNAESGCTPEGTSARPPGRPIPGTTACAERYYEPVEGWHAPCWLLYVSTGSSSRRFRAGPIAGLLAVRCADACAHPRAAATPCCAGNEAEAGSRQGRASEGATADLQGSAETTAESGLPLEAQAGLAASTFERQHSAGPARHSPFQPQPSPLTSKGHRGAQAEASQALKLRSPSGRSDTGPGKRRLPAGPSRVSD
jgi:hypothetical protein